jgi:hypothetical protein
MATTKKHTETNGDEALNRMRENDPELAEMIPAHYKKTVIGFPPYFVCQVGKAFRGTVLLRDERDPNFVRYHIQSSTVLDCQTGPIDDGVVITVQPGEVFTLGAYAALPLERMFGLEVAVLCKGQRRLPLKPEDEGIPRDLFEFEVFVDPETEKMLASQRLEDQAYLKEAAGKARKLALDNMVQMMMAPKKKRETQATA